LEWISSGTPVVVTLASFVRLLGFLIQAAIALLLFMSRPGWLAVLLGVIAIIAVGIISERLYRRLASPEEQRQDLEDRVRNPPS
jgi:hypothetical protein